MVQEEADPSAKTEISLLFRVKIAAEIIWGLRVHDFRAARTYICEVMTGKYYLCRICSFVRWVLGLMFVDIPEIMATSTFDQPVSRRPFWLIDENPLADHPWANEPHAVLPDAVDTVVIGAGFSGGSCAYHWSKHAPGDRQMVVLEMDDPASGSSGRNEGAVVMGRYFTKIHDTVLKDLPRTRSDLSASERQKLAEQFAHVYCKAAYKSSDLIAETITREGFDCDYYRNGWVEATEDDMLEVMEESVTIGRDTGFDDRTIISTEQVTEKTGIRTNNPGTFSRGCASWHPAKWVWCLFQAALRQPHVKLFTRTRVRAVEDSGETYKIITSRGTIHARYVINATEAYTAVLHPQFKDKMIVRQTQAAVGDGGPAAIKPHRIISGPKAFWGRVGQSVLFGTDTTIIPYRNAGQNKPSRFLTKFFLTHMLEDYGPSEIHVTNEWSGSVGFTSDEFPIIGKIDGKRQYLIGGMVGSGSNVSFNAGRCLVGRVLGADENGDDYPPEYFAPTRILDPNNHPWPAIKD